MIEKFSKEELAQIMSELGMPTVSLKRYANNSLKEYIDKLFDEPFREPIFKAISIITDYVTFTLETAVDVSTMAIHMERGIEGTYFRRSSTIEGFTDYVNTFKRIADCVKAETDKHEHKRQELFNKYEEIKKEAIDTLEKRAAAKERLMKNANETSGLLKER